MGINNDIFLLFHQLYWKIINQLYQLKKGDVKGCFNGLSFLWIGVGSELNYELKSFIAVNGLIIVRIEKERVVTKEMDGVV